MKTLIVVAALVAGCHSRDRAQTRETEEPRAANASASDPQIAAAVAEANRRIVARQRAVKAWQSLQVPVPGAPSCPQAPKLDLHVDGFQTGSHQAEQSMVIVSADEIAGRPDSSLPPEVAKDMQEIDRAARGAPAPLGWATIDYTTDELPFAPGPRAKAFQYALAEVMQRGDRSLLAKANAALDGDEVILITESRTRAEVAGDTFNPASMAGVALVWSYTQGKFVCAGRFEAMTTSKEFVGSRAQVENMPEEEVRVRAYANAAASLRNL